MPIPYSNDIPCPLASKICGYRTGEIGAFCSIGGPTGGNCTGIGCPLLVGIQNPLQYVIIETLVVRSTAILLSKTVQHGDVLEHNDLPAFPRQLQRSASQPFQLFLSVTVAVLTCQILVIRCTQIGTASVRIGRIGQVHAVQRDHPHLAGWHIQIARQ